VIIGEGSKKKRRIYRRDVSSSQNSKLIVYVDGTLAMIEEKLWLFSLGRPQNSRRLHLLSLWDFILGMDMKRSKIWDLLRKVCLGQI